MSKIEEVKRILLPHIAGLNLSADEIKDLTDKIAHQICQLFEKPDESRLLTDEDKLTASMRRNTTKTVSLIS